MGWVLDDGVVTFLSPVEIHCQTFTGVPAGWIGFHSGDLDRRLTRLRVLEGSTGTRRLRRLFSSFKPSRLGRLLDGEPLTERQMSVGERREVASFLGWLRPCGAASAPCGELRVFRLPWYVVLYYGGVLDRPLVADQSRSVTVGLPRPVTLVADHPVTVSAFAAQLSSRAGLRLTVDRRWRQARVVAALHGVAVGRSIGILARALGAPLREVGGALHVGYPVPAIGDDARLGLKSPGRDFGVTLDGQAIRRGDLAGLTLSAMFPGMVILARCGKETLQILAFAHDASGGRPVVAKDVNCGLSSLRWMAQALGSPISEAQWGTLLSRYNKPSVSMLELLQAAQEIGVSLKGFQISASELAAMRSPALINTDRYHFMTLLGFTEKGAQVKDGDSEATMTLSMEEFAARYGGYALLPATAAAGVPAAP